MLAVRPSGDSVPWAPVLKAPSQLGFAGLKLTFVRDHPDGTRYPCGAVSSSAPFWRLSGCKPDPAGAGL